MRVMRRGHPLNAGRALWLRDGGAGGRWGDVTGNGRHGTLVNGPGWDSPPFGPAVSFASAGSQTVAVPDISGQFSRSEASIAFWIRRRAQTPGSSSAAGTLQIGTGGNNGTYFPFTNGLIYCALFDTARNIDGVADVSGVDRTRWRRMCLTTAAGSGNYRLYFNGVLFASATRTGFSAVTFNLGISTSGSSYLDGWMADVSVWSRPLSPFEVYMDYATSAAGYPPGPDCPLTDEYER